MKIIEHKILEIEELCEDDASSREEGRDILVLILKWWKLANKISLDDFLKASKDHNYRTKFREMMREFKKRMKFKQIHGYDLDDKGKVDFKLGGCFLKYMLNIHRQIRLHTSVF